MASWRLPRMYPRTDHYYPLILLKLSSSLPIFEQFLVDPIFPIVFLVSIGGQSQQMD